MTFNFFSHSRRKRNVLSSLLALTGAIVISGCGGGSGGPSGGSGGGGGGGTVLGVNTIVFVSDRDGNFEIYRSNNTGTNQVRITNSAAAEDNPFIARNRQFIVFASNRDGNFEIYRFNVIDSTLQRLTTDTTVVDDNFPVVSPDSTKIAWISGRGGTNNLWTMDATGANQVQITTTGATSPTFSPDGTQIAYLNPANNIVVRTLATGVERVITTGVVAPSTIADLTWSPNGANFGYTLVQGGAAGIRVIASNATNTSAAVTFAATNNSKASLTWGPTAAQQQLAFVNVANVAGGGIKADVFSAVTVNATAANQLTTLGNNFAVSWVN